jgi:hypothetical protein
MKIKRTKVKTDEQFNKESYPGEGIYINSWDGYEGLFIVNYTTVHFVGSYADFINLFPETIEEKKKPGAKEKDQPKLITEEFALKILETGIKAAK